MQQQKQNLPYDMSQNIPYMIDWVEIFNHCQFFSNKYFFFFRFSFLRLILFVSDFRFFFLLYDDKLMKSAKKDRLLSTYYCILIENRFIKQAFIIVILFCSNCIIMVLTLSFFLQNKNTY